MKVMVIVKASKESEAGEMPTEQAFREMGRFNEELVNAGIMLQGEGLHPSSKGKRVHFSGKNRTVIDGPFAETKELIAGFWMWKVSSIEEAVEWVKKCPNPMISDSDIDIRPVFEADDFGEAFTPELREQEAAIRAKSLGLGFPRFEEGRSMTLAGLKERYTSETRGSIAQHWDRFVPHLGKVAGQVGDIAYGVCLNSDHQGGLDYVTAVEVSGSGSLPKSFVSVAIPARRYIVFTHDEHVSKLDKTFDAIWRKWAPECGLKIADSPCFERYTSEFDPTTGRGGTEVWVPISHH